MSFCEKKLGGIVHVVRKLEIEVDRVFIVKINFELKSYLDAMEKTKFDCELFVD
jgi:hypothetical protein